MKEIIKKNTQTIAWIIAGVIITLLLYAYFVYREYYPSTDDAYVEAHVVHIAPHITGPVTQIFVKNNQMVHKGDLLFMIDPRPYQNAIDRDKAGLLLAWQKMRADTEAIKVAESEVDRTRAQLVVALKNYDRIHTLVASNQASLASDDDAKAQLDVAKAALSSAKNQLLQVEQKLGDIGELNADIIQAKVALQQSDLNMEYTQIKAPTDGYLTNFEVRVGSIVIAYRPLFQIVESQTWWVYANYKETEMERIKAGQPATIKVDMYPNHTFQGVVDSISRGSGAVFSLLPPENATGNWVKVTQRFPVKIIITDTDPNYPLRVGASAEVTVNTTITKNE